MLYADLVVEALGRNAARMLEVVTQLDGREYEFRSRSFRDLFAKGRAEGRAEVLSTLRLALPEIVATRGLDVSAKARERVETEDDADTLRRWIVRAATATDEAAIFDRP